MKLTQFNGAGGNWGTHLKDYQVTPMSSRALLDYYEIKIREAKVHLDVSLYYFLLEKSLLFK